MESLVAQEYFISFSLFQRHSVYPSSGMETESVSETDYDSILTWLVTQEDFIALISLLMPLHPWLFNIKLI